MPKTVDFDLPDHGKQWYLTSQTTENSGIWPPKTVVFDLPKQGIWPPQTVVFDLPGQWYLTRGWVWVRNPECVCVGDPWVYTYGCTRVPVGTPATGTPHPAVITLTGRLHVRDNVLTRLDHELRNKGPTQSSGTPDPWQKTSLLMDRLEGPFGQKWLI